MRDRDRLFVGLDSAHRLNVVITRLTANHPIDNCTPLDRMRANQGHLRGSRFDQARAQVSGVSDPTASTAGAYDAGTDDLRRLDKALESIVKATRTIERITDANAEPRLANELDRLALDRLNVKPDAGCGNCARIEGPLGGPRWEPVDTRHTNATTVGDRLDVPMFLCSWCYDAVIRWSRLPSAAELERHHRGQPVPWPSDVARPS